MKVGLVNSMRAELGLTEEQDAAVTGIFKVSQERRQELRDKYRGLSGRSSEGLVARRS
jgi:hypothetical protein